MSMTGRPRRKLGEILLKHGAVDEKRLGEVLELQEQLGKRMGQILVEKGWVSEEVMLTCLSEQFGLPLVRLRSGLYDPAAVTLVGKECARRLELLPLFKVRDTLFVATAEPQALPRFDEIETRTGLRVRPVLARSADILRTVEEAYAGAGMITDYVEDLGGDFELIESEILKDYTVIDEMAEGSPVVNLVNGIIQRAVRDGASDIHIEPGRQKCRVRFRIDGLLYEIMTPKMELHAAIVSRLKVIASLDISERRLPQDGRIQVSTQGRTVDLRFSSLPGIFGEKLVLRVLDKNRTILDVHKLGMTDENLETFKNLMNISHGLVLATGPTGSGKSTTLYAAISHLNTLEKNIVTIEDPVEYQLDIINQNQVREGIGLGFARMLKHVLRQDPDIIMVGEIREHETAEIAVQAALTGHLVLSTLHTNDSVGAITRLLDMGIEPYLLSSALAGVVAQRLVRQVCPECRTTFLPSPEVAQRLGLQGGEAIRLARGRGCSSCYDSGYKGRISIHEILPCDTPLQRLINARPTREQLEQHIGERGIKTLYEDGLARVRQGVSTLEEIYRAVNIG